LYFKGEYNELFRYVFTVRQLIHSAKEGLAAAYRGGGKIAKEVSRWPIKSLMIALVVEPVPSSVQ
jgi:hypothetical protein